MLIGELSSRSGLSRDTIRFYEKRGMVSLDKKQRRDNNYKEYPDAVLDRLLTIKRIKHFGFTLNEIADILVLMELEEATCGNVAGLMAEKLMILDAKIADLVRLRQQLTDGMQQCTINREHTGTDACCPILTSDQFLNR